MKTVNVHEAKTHLSRLLEAAAGGQEIIIAKSGKPIARLVPIQQGRMRRKGLLKGRIRIGKLFEALLPQGVILSFEKGGML